MAGSGDAEKRVVMVPHDVLVAVIGDISEARCAVQDEAKAAAALDRAHKAIRQLLAGEESHANANNGNEAEGQTTPESKGG